MIEPSSQSTDPPVASAIPFVRSGSYPTRSGNSVRPWIDGEPAFRRICDAIEAARHRVWVTVTFMWPTFAMPDGHGTALDVLDRAAARGVDVRIIFWRPDAETDHLKRNAFWGSAAHFGLLEERRSGVKLRWDRADPGFCQHQKSWVIDAGDDDATAFVGGINLNPHSVVAPGHRGEAQNHDAYVELAGPSIVDVQHNFVQRWNEASERSAHDGRWGIGSKSDLPFPTRTPASQGSVVVQVQRTMAAGRYRDDHPAPGALPYAIAAGERTNFEQYRAAIDAASRSIYIENQFLDVPEIVGDLHRALHRGVVVVVLMPGELASAASATNQPEPSAMRPSALREAYTTLGAHEHFTLAGIAGIGADGRRTPVHVHAKLMLIDDAWATVGSCNLHRYSLFGNGELNIAFADSDTVRALRSELFREHLDHVTSDMDDRGALRLFREIALENRRRFAAGDHAWQGLAFALDPTTSSKPGS